jgi:hypothetical protein
MDYIMKFYLARMGTIGDFVIDSVIFEDNKILGFAVYPLYVDNYFKSIRSVMKSHSLNTFRIDAHDLYLHNPLGSASEFYKIIIEDIDEKGFPIIQKISDSEFLKYFKNSIGLSKKILKKE